jgi:DNA-binding GntR family transcriptional regulator
MVNHKLSDKIYHELKEKIITGQFPQGTKFTEETLAVTLGTSRTPVREAINRLASDGFVDLLPYRGAYIKKVSAKHVEEIYDVRKVLEGYAVVLAIKHITKQDLARISKQIDAYEKSKTIKDKLDTFVAYDEALHSTIINCCNNLRLIKILNDLYSAFDSFRILATKQLLHLDIGHEDHKKIYHSLETKDSDAARRAVELHIDHAKQNVLEDFVYNAKNNS